MRPPVKISGRDFVRAIGVAENGAVIAAVVGMDNTGIESGRLGSIGGLNLFANWNLAV